MPWSLGEDFGGLEHAIYQRLFHWKPTIFLGTFMETSIHQIYQLSAWWFGTSDRFFFSDILEFLIIPTDELIFFGRVAKKHHPVF